MDAKVFEGGAGRNGGIIQREGCIWRAVEYFTLERVPSVSKDHRMGLCK
jgi:hypothetical protein